jgi:phosphoribosylanthranilate isomerase
VRPFGIDSCTRTNAVDGDGRPVRFQKDYRKVARLLAAVRRAEQFLDDQGGSPLGQDA